MDPAIKLHPSIYCQVDSLLALRHLSRNLHITPGKLCNSAIAGLVRTRYKGRGMSFAEVRPYQAGDDVRSIDWRVTARTQKPYTKLYEEERERPVYIIVDMRSPMFFGSATEFKCVFAAKVATAIAWAAFNQGDRVGALIMRDQQTVDLRPKRGKNAVLALIHALVESNALLENPALASRASLADVLDDARRIVRPGALVYVLSDMSDNPDYAPALSRLARHADVELIHVFDALEQALPAQSVTLSNGDEQVTMASPKQRDALAKRFSERQELVKQMCNQCMIRGFSAITTTTAEQWLLNNFVAGGRRRSR